MIIEFEETEKGIAEFEDIFLFTYYYVSQSKGVGLKMLTLL